MCDMTGCMNIDPDQFAATFDGTGAGQRLMVEVAGGGHGVLSGRKPSNYSTSSSDQSRR